MSNFSTLITIIFYYFNNNNSNLAKPFYKIKPDRAIPSAEVDKVVKHDAPPTE